jgi:hypothetical protein
VYCDSSNEPSGGWWLTLSPSEGQPFAPLNFFLRRMRRTPKRGLTLSLTVQYEPLPLSAKGRGTFSKQGFRERLWRTEF